jgi:hypothetical protein
MSREEALLPLVVLRDRGNGPRYQQHPVGTTLALGRLDPIF